MMKKVLYINCSSGISGDMFLGALISAGVSQKYLEEKLSYLMKYGVKKPFFQATPVERNHIPCVSIKISDDYKFSSTNQINKLIKQGPLPEKIKKTASTILNKLISAESEVHNIAKKDVHFHELNSKDTLVDVLGAAIGVDYFGDVEIISSPINIGAANPATLFILKNSKVPVYSDNHRFELTTPTGAAIISTIASKFGAIPLLELESSGFGAGSFEIPERSNILRVVIGKLKSGVSSFYHREKVYLLETNIDDMNPQIYPYIMEKLFEMGALDVWFENIIMKQGRPAVKLSVLCIEDKLHLIIDTIFDETTTGGIRYIEYDRVALRRKQLNSKKVFYLSGGLKKSKVEYKFARKVAKDKNLPLKNFF